MKKNEGNIGILNSNFLEGVQWGEEDECALRRTCSPLLYVQELVLQSIY